MEDTVEAEQTSRGLILFGVRIATGGIGHGEIRKAEFLILDAINEVRLVIPGTDLKRDRTGRIIIGLKVVTEELNLTYNGP